MAIPLEPFERQFRDFGDAIQMGANRWSPARKATGPGTRHGHYRSCRERHRWRGGLTGLAHRWTTLRVPASSANLGRVSTPSPGAELYLECRFRRSTELSIQAWAATRNNLHGSGQSHLADGPGRGRGHTR